MKKLISLLLSLVLVFSLVACDFDADSDPKPKKSKEETSQSDPEPKPKPQPQPEANPIPDAGDTLEALLYTIFRNDTTQMGRLFGYTSYDAVIDDLLGGQNPSNLLIDGFVVGFSSSIATEGYTVDPDTAEEVGTAFIDLLARIPFSCTTVSADEGSGKALVTVSVATLPSGWIESDLPQYLTDHYMDQLESAASMDAIYDIVFDATIAYANQLKPSANRATFQVNCTLETDLVNGQRRDCWVPVDSEALGAQFVSSAFGIQLS